MCTGFVKRGSDVLYGFNLDIDPAVWDFKLYKNDRHFTVGIRVGSTLYYTHGVNSDGHFGNLPYMNGDGRIRSDGKGRERIDQLTDRYIRNKYSFDDVLNAVRTKNVVNIPNGSMHSLLADADGRCLLVEAGYGYKEIEDSFAVITNFPLLDPPTDDSPFYGRKRFEAANALLSADGEGFSAADGLELLRAVKQEGQWATRLSFVYSVRERCVYYALDGDFDNVKKHCFSAQDRADA